MSRLGALVLALVAAMAVADGARNAPPVRAATAGPRADFAAYRGGVPVLLYHRLTPSTREYTVAPSTFEAQMGRLHDLGFEAITLRQYVRFMSGEAVDLPRRPFLITFDDGYPSAWKHADPVLARYGWSAVMYVATGLVGRPGIVTWDDLRQMRQSGRWQIDVHAGNGHVLVAADESGRRRPFYAAEMWAGGRKESFAHYRRRVSNDIDVGLAALARNLPGWASYGSFAVPFGNYGQNGSNDPRIEPWFRAHLERRFAVVFVQRDDSFTKPGQAFANRIAVSSRWTGVTLQRRLLRGLARLKASARAGRPG